MHFATETPLLERIARVLADPESNNWILYVGKAREIVDALRGPTVDMLEAARPGIPFIDDLAEDWDAMVEQAVHALDVQLAARPRALSQRA